MTRRPEFSHLLNNPFSEGVSSAYVGPFNILWVDTDGAYRITRLGKGGNVLRETRTGLSQKRREL